MWKLLDRLFGRRAPEVPDPVLEKAPEKTPAPALWESDMALRSVGPGERADYPRCSYGTVRVRWVSRQTGEDGEPVSIREPQPETSEQPADDFVAAGRHYAELKLIQEKDAGGSWYLDMYGRRVLCVLERFPCFDESDYLYENRYYRWYFLFENGRLTRVQHTDGTPTVTVTEDVSDLERRCWEAIRELECFR